MAQHGWAAGQDGGHVGAPGRVGGHRLGVRPGAGQVSPGLCRRRSCLDSRQAVPSQRLGEDLLEDKIQQLKLRLEDSEKKMLEFAKQQQIVDVNDKSSIAETNLGSANVALGTLISERTKNEQLWQQVENADAINLPQLLSDSVIEDLRSQRKTLVVEYQEKLETFKPSYPVMVQINNKIKEIDQQLAAEVQAIKGSLKAAYEASLAQENDMKARIETLRQRSSIFKTAAFSTIF